MPRKHVVNRPVVGVTGPDGRIVPSWWFIRWAIRRAGGQPVRMTPRKPRSEVQPDAVVISGGEDIAPDLYGGMMHGTAVPTDSERDAFEMRVLDRALDSGLPVLGICRGAQLINVVLGGNLHQDLREIRHITSNRRTPLPCKTIAIRPRSRLANIQKRRRTRVNSLHHQSVARRGRGLQVCAIDSDGIVQAIEAPEKPWLLGVQWHPEYLPYQRRQRALFVALINACRK